jgi:hypothetical protein
MAMEDTHSYKMKSSLCAHKYIGERDKTYDNEQLDTVIFKPSIEMGNQSLE